MEFAERHLRERGWRGKGLGRREDGISEPITVKVKCDKAGIGHRMGEQFTFHWWDHVFNKAAENVLVDTAEVEYEVLLLQFACGLTLAMEEAQDRKHGVRLRQADSDTEQQEDGPVTNKKPRKAQQCRHLLYGRFIKSATLTPGTEGEVPVPSPSSDTSDSDSDSDEDEKLDLSSTTRLTDEELVRVCGGRTGHKGARHGVTMNAKLLRLEAQEREFLAKYRQEPAAGGIETETGTEGRTKKKRKKKRRQSCPGGGDGGEEEERERPRGEVTVGGRGERRKRRKGRGREEEEGDERLQGEVEGEERVQGELTAGKRKKCRGREEEVEGEQEGKQQGEVTAGKRKRRGREEEVEGEERLQGDVTAGERRKRCKRRKGRGEEEGEVTTGGAEEGEGQERAISAGKRRKLRREEEKERLQGAIPAEEVREPQGGRPEGEAGAGGRGKRGSRRRKAERREREETE